MDEKAGTAAPHRYAPTPRSGRSPRVTGFPGWTHIVASLAFPAWSISTDARLYGIDTRYDWWSGFGDFMTALAVATLVVALPPAVALEAWAVTRARSRWPARIAVLGYVLVSGFLTFLPTGLRFFGDASPVPVDTVMVSLATYAIVICAQVLCAYLVCRRWRRRKYP